MAATSESAPVAERGSGHAPKRARERHIFKSVLKVKLSGGMAGARRRF